MAVAHRVHRADLLAAVGAAALIAVAAAVAVIYSKLGHPVKAAAAPFFAHWLPHWGYGSGPAMLLAAAGVWWGPRICQRLSWRALLMAAYAAAFGWIFSLAMVDGWHRGVAGRLTTRTEYLSDIRNVRSVGQALHEFTARIIDFRPDSWTVHVSGHPPGALLVFVWLNRLGLSGGAPAALVCIAAGAVAAVAVPVAVRALGSERAARLAVPFTVFFPGAVWLGVSADAIFAGVCAAGLACLAIGLGEARPDYSRPVAWSVVAGLLLGFGCYLSYGLVLIALPAVAMVVIAAHRRRAFPWVALLATLLAVIAVATAFTAAGFWWPAGYHAVKIRYFQGIASARPYSYWVWANMASLIGAIGLASVAVLRRALISLRAHPFNPVVAVPLAALAAVAVADVSGLSKAEVERIWLPFAIWIPGGAAMLPYRSHRFWLVVQTGLALLVNHLLLTVW